MSCQDGCCPPSALKPPSILGSRVDIGGAKATVLFVGEVQRSIYYFDFDFYSIGEHTLSEMSTHVHGQHVGRCAQIQSSRCGILQAVPLMYGGEGTHIHILLFF